MTEPADPLLDTNILLCHLLGDHADHSPRAQAFIGQVEFALEEGCVRLTRIGSIIDATAGALRAYAIFNDDGSPPSAAQLREIAEIAWAEEATERGGTR